MAEMPKHQIAAWHGALNLHLFGSVARGGEASEQRHRL
jgi:predicted nucleotidyltransferase